MPIIGLGHRNAGEPIEVILNGPTKETDSETSESSQAPICHGLVLELASGSCMADMCIFGLLCVEASFDVGNTDRRSSRYACTHTFRFVLLI